MSFASALRLSSCNKSLHAWHDWTTRMPHNGHAWRKFCTVPRLHPLRTRITYLVQKVRKRKRAFRLAGEAGDDFHGTVESLPGQIRHQEPVSSQQPLDPRPSLALPRHSLARKTPSEFYIQKLLAPPSLFLFSALSQANAQRAKQDALIRDLRMKNALLESQSLSRRIMSFVSTHAEMSQSGLHNRWINKLSVAQSSEPKMCH